MDVLKAIQKARGRSSGGSKSSKTSSFKDASEKIYLKLWDRVETFSKLITQTYLLVWIEVILFSEVATILSFGDSASIQYITENVTELGKYVFGFYFSTKVIENAAQGVEDLVGKIKSSSGAPEAPAAPTTDNADSDTEPAGGNDG